MEETRLFGGLRLWEYRRELSITGERAGQRGRVVGGGGQTARTPVCRTKAACGGLSRAQRKGQGDSRVACPCDPCGCSAAGAEGRWKGGLNPGVWAELRWDKCQGSGIQLVRLEVREGRSLMTGLEGTGCLCGEGGRSQCQKPTPSQSPAPPHLARPRSPSLATQLGIHPGQGH